MDQGPLVLSREFFSSLNCDSGSFLKLVKTINEFAANGKVKLQASRELSCYFDGPKLFNFSKIPKPLTSGNKLGNESMPRITVLTRTVGDRPELLDRNIRSVRELREKAGNFSVSHHIFTPDLQLSQSLSKRDLKVEHLATDTHEDSRTKLLIELIKSTTSEYFWVVDDDDWINPEIAISLDSLMGLNPDSGLIFLDSIHAHERGGVKPKIRGNRYLALNAVKSFMGPNQTPICSVIFPKASFSSKTLEAGANLKVLEDHYLINKALASVVTPPTFIPEVGVFISVRTSGQIVTSSDRSPWNTANAELAYITANETSINLEALLSVANHLRRATQSEWVEVLFKLVTLPLKRGFWKALGDFKSRLFSREQKRSLSELIELVRRSNF
jgi:hypothetical protein